MKKRFLVLMLAIVTLFTLTSCSKKYTVTFDTDGGSKIASVEVKKGKTVAKPADPTQPGFEFEGWELNGKEYNFSTKVKGDITLKAVWKEVKEECSHVWKDATYQHAKDNGDENVYFIDGPTLMAIAKDGGSVDGTHPTDLGYYSMAQAVGTVFEKIFRAE